MQSVNVLDSQVIQRTFRPLVYQNMSDATAITLPKEYRTLPTAIADRLREMIAEGEGLARLMRAHLARKAEAVLAMLT